MPFTKVQIISRAFNLIGKGSISNIGTDQLSAAASDAFDLLLEADLSGGMWRFAADIIQLNQLVQVPIDSRFRYIYQLPSDYLKLIRLYPQTWDFEIYKDGKIYTNVNNNLFLEYIRMVDVTALPPYFVKYITHELASWLAASNAQQPALTQYLDQKTDIYRSQAMAFDAQNRPQTPMVSAPVISNRFIATVIAD